jgi:hypothetical protein
MRGTPLVVLVIGLCALGVGAAACDSRAKASDPQKPESFSKEYETCASTASCAENLRCFDHVCTRTNRSTVGDYFAALGATQLRAGKVDEAIDSYKRATGHYDTASIAVPADVDCAYGAALAVGKAKKDNAELGARVLHRCLLALPPGGALRRQALLDLASLSDAGLDPLALGRTALTDVYLTGAPAGPSTDKLTVTVTASPTPSGKTYQAIPDRITGPDLKPALVACWTQYNAASKKDALAVTIGVKSSYSAEYDDEPGVFSMKIDPPSGVAAGSPEAAADQCVRAAVEPALKDLKEVRDSFQTKLTITVK